MEMKKLGVWVAFKGRILLSFRMPKIEMVGVRRNTQCVQGEKPLCHVYEHLYCIFSQKNEQAGGNGIFSNLATNQSSTTLGFD